MLFHLALYSCTVFASAVGQNQVPGRLLMPLLQGRLRLCRQQYLHLYCQGTPHRCSRHPHQTVTDTSLASRQSSCTRMWHPALEVKGCPVGARRSLLTPPDPHTHIFKKCWLCWWKVPPSVSSASSTLPAQ